MKKFKAGHALTEVEQSFIDSLEESIKPKNPHLKFDKNGVPYGI